MGFVNESKKRREELQDAAISCVLKCARLSFDLGFYAQADRYAEAVLAKEPLREAAWRLRMRTAAALGSSDEILAIYTECLSALAAIGTEPARETKILLDQLRY